MSSGAEMVLQTDRSWDMQVWQLQGKPSTWGAQLLRLQAEHPVFALASGLGAGNWESVQRFCEQQALPCWFPSVAAVPAQSSFYSVYFSRGAALEAEVLATSLTAGGKRGKLLQVYADAGVADSAVTAMRARMVMIQVQCTWMRNLNPPHLFRRLDASLMGDRRGGSDTVSTGTPSPLIATHFASTLHRRTV